MIFKREIIFLLLIVSITVGCGSETLERQEQVAEAGAEVMPFELERTTHIFEKRDSGGLQQVLSDDGDGEQVALIRMHLADEAARFSRGDFHDPAMIHGEDMAGLHELTQGTDQLTIHYSDVDGGGQILYTTEDGELVAALHAWFDQQVADHGAHAQAARPTPVETTAGAANSGTRMGSMGMGSMGMGMDMMGNRSMRVAHHAEIPEAYAGLTNPIAADPGSLERGAAIFTSRCAVCHGDGGMGDGPGAVNQDPPVSPIAHTSQMMSDAYLFWRISEGGQGNPLKSAMPSWKDTLDEQARWDVINYVQAIGRGEVQPQHNMGGAAFDPAVEQQNRLEMLAEAMDSGLIDRAEADTFDLVHTDLDSLMAETGLRMQGDNLPALLAILVERTTFTQAQVDTFADVHDLLIEAGLMR